jgi:hypothetical protein
LTPTRSPARWKRGEPEAVRKGCELRKAEKEKPFEPWHHPITYAYPNDYKDIIAKGDNWQAVFSIVFANSKDE